LNHIGFIFQDYNLFPTLTAVENVEYVLWLQKVAAAERRERAVAALKRVGLEKFIKRRPNALSRGQQQRVAICRAIVHKPSLVLGDELTANLDHKTGEELMEFLKELNQTDHITFVYATHDPVMMQKAKRVIKMQDGRIIE
jgi:putative ABC transport system ATP-binding protein